MCPLSFASDNNTVSHYFGDHICSIYRTSAEQYSSVLPFLIDGLIRHQKCVYVTDERTVTEITDELFHRGFPVSKYISSMQMVFYTKEETYLSHGYFDADHLIATISAGIRDSRIDGYKGVRASGEMTWALNNATTPDKLVAYESQLNAAFPGEHIDIFCQYNETKFLPDVLTDILRTHPKVCLYGNVYDNTYFYTPPEWMSLSDPSTARSAYKEMIREIISAQ